MAQSAIDPIERAREAGAEIERPEPDRVLARFDSADIEVNRLIRHHGWRISHETDRKPGVILVRFDH